MTQTTEQVAKPVPVPDEASQPFFDGAQRGVLMIRRCNQCGIHLAPAQQLCHQCLSHDLEWVEASGHATLHTFGVMHQQYHPGFLDEIPYNLAEVELEEGPRFRTNIVGVSNEQLEIGMALEATFEEAGEGVWLPKFRPAG